MFNYSYADTHSRALTDDEIYKYAPSVFAVTAHESRSERFKPIPTIKVVDALRREGFEVVSAQQSNAREDKRNFTKHMLRLRHVNDLANVTNKDKMSDSHAEVILKNAQDGTSAYQLMAGIYRLVCSNGMVGFSNTFNDVKVRHSGSEETISRNVVEGTFTVIEQADLLLEKREKWSNIKMSPDAQLAYAEAAHMLKFGDKDGNIDTPISPRQLLTVRRSGDSGDSLWLVHNRVQEACLKGGMRAYNTQTQRRTTVRPVKSIDVDIKLNKALWRLSSYFEERAA
jgi:hypothetical protein